MLTKATRVTASVCLLDQRLNLLLLESKSPAGGLAVEFITFEIDLHREQVPAKIADCFRKLQLDFTAAQAQPWFFQAYHQAEQPGLALLYYLAVSSFPPPVSQLKWYSSAALTETSFKRPSALFLPYITKVLPSFQR